MTCKDCLHYEICCERINLTKSGVKLKEEYIYIGNNRDCNFFKDKSKFIEIDFGIGEQTFNIFYSTIADFYKIEIRKITEIVFTKNGTEIVFDNDTRLYLTDFNHWWFIDQSKAEAKLMELNNETNN